MAASSLALGPLWLMFLFGFGGAGLPMGIPPAPPDPLMSRTAPESCLYYLSWAGTAVPQATSKNQTEQLLAEPQVKQLVAGIERIVRAAIQKEARKNGPEASAAADDITFLVKHLLTHPAALFVADVVPNPAAPKIEAGLILSLGDDAAKFQALIDRYSAKLPGELIQSRESEGVKWRQLNLASLKPGGGPEIPITWGIKQKYLIVAVGEGQAEAIVKRAGGKPPKWLEAIDKALPVARRSTLAFVNVDLLREKFLPMAPPDARHVVEVLGLTNLEALVAVTGLDEQGSVSKSLIKVQGPGKGLLELADNRPLAAKDLAPIPLDSTIAWASRLELKRLYDTLLSLAGQLDPSAAAKVDAVRGEAKSQLGFDPHDLIEALGDTVCVYNSPAEGGFVITGLTAVLSVKDHARLRDIQEKLLALARGEMERAKSRGKRPSIEKSTFAGQDIHYLITGEKDFILTPAWCLTEKELIVAVFPQNIKAYLGHGRGYKSLAEQPDVAAALHAQPGPLSLAYQDSAALVKLVYPMLQLFASAGANALRHEGIEFDPNLLPSADALLPHLRPGVSMVRRTQAGIEFEQRQVLPGGGVGAAGPVAVALVLPAVQSARQAARKAQSMNNLKQIGLAMLQYETVHNRLPVAYVADKQGKPLLSWRVTILPYIDQKPLYDQFHRDEPWDSEHNKKLVEKMPVIYRSPTSMAGPGKTNYLTIRGEKTAFPGKQGVSIAEVTDGMSNTLAVVEANDSAAVIWTRPNDYQPDPNNVTRGLLGPYPGGFNAIFLDGHVEFISVGENPTNLKAMFTRNGGEVINR